MGAFPSHDAPELLYTTVVTRPTTETRVEVCLVPLLPRFFNDGHKKLKKKLSDLLTQKLTNQSSTAGAAANSGTPTPATTGSGGGGGSRNTTAGGGKRQDQAGGTALVDYIMSCTESFFYVNTKFAVGSKDGPHEDPQHKHRMSEKFGPAGYTPQATGPGIESAAFHQPQQQQPHFGSHTTGVYNAIPSTTRPVPFAVCILETENSYADSNTSTSNPQHSSSKHHHQAQGAHTVLIKGRRMHLVGFISCCMDRLTTQLNTSVPQKLNVFNGAGSNSSSMSPAAAAPTAAISSFGTCKLPTYPVVLDVVFDDMEAHGYLTESVVILASFAFRKQFVDSCALHYPVGDNDVEDAFDRQMERLQLRIVLRHDNYRDLRMFYSHYALLDMIKDVEMHKVQPTHFSLYENSFGEYGLEVTFGSKFLARWMRFVQKKMTVESVNGYYVRCVVSDLLQERYTLMQERQDSGAFLEEEEEDERLFGGPLLSDALKRWLLAGSQSLIHQQMHHPNATQSVLFPGNAAAAVGGGMGAALGGYWPQMPMMMGATSSWPAGVVPFNPAATHITPVMGQQPPFVIPGNRTQIIYAAPQGGSTFVTQGGMHIVPSAAGHYGVMAAAPQQQQQILYVLPGGQIAQAAPQQQQQPQQATVVQPTAATAGGAPPAAFPPTAIQQVYYAAPSTYAVSYQPYMYQQSSLPPPPPPALQ